jgi:hypothetical protein
MGNTNGQLRGPESRTDLHETSRITGQDQLRSWVSRRQPGYFLLEHGPRHGRPQDRINSGGAAALLRSGQQLQPEAWNGAEHLQWSFMHPLGVLQVAWGIVGHVERERSTWSRPSFGEQFGHIAYHEPKASRFLGSQQMSVVLE